MSFNGLGLHLGNLSLLSNAETRSCSPENPTGAKNQGGRFIDPNMESGFLRDLGHGWKSRPNVAIPIGETLVITDVEGPGAIQQIWLTINGNRRHTILRCYYDGEESPSIEVPIGDFFASAFSTENVFAPIVSAPICVNPGSGWNSYWEMPFRKHCRITLENIGYQQVHIYYQVNYTLTEVPDDAAYLHAQFRRSNPVGRKQVHTIVEGIRGHGHYVGTYMAWQVNNNGWWGEGEVKFYLDGDLPPGRKVSDAVAEHGGDCYPTICGTGAEDYFCGSNNFENKLLKRYQEFTTPYAGMPHVVRPDGLYVANTRFSLYRWHILDPIRFKQDLAVTIQALGHGSPHSYKLESFQDDVSSVALWYQSEPHAPFPVLPDREGLDII